MSSEKYVLANLKEKCTLNIVKCVLQLKPFLYMKHVIVCAKCSLSFDKVIKHSYSLYYIMI